VDRTSIDSTISDKKPSLLNLVKRKDVLLSTKDLNFGYVPFSSSGEEGYALVGRSSLLGNTCFAIRF